MSIGDARILNCTLCKKKIDPKKQVYYEIIMSDHGKKARILLLDERCYSKTVRVRA